MTAPAVSVIMATYNGGALVGETIASLKAQSFGDFEVVIVDDGSTDDTRERLRAIDDPRFKVIEAAVNQGPVHARNRAVDEARGRYLAALDQDDLCHPDRLGEQVRHLDAHPEMVVLGTAANVIEGGALRTSLLPSVTTGPLVEWMLWISNPLIWSSVMLRSEAARKLHPFTRPERQYAEDFDLYHRISPFGRIGRLDRELLSYRSHGGGASQRFTERMNANAARVLADRHTAILGESAADRARLLVDHVMERRPVAGRAAMAMLGETLVLLQEAFIASRMLRDDDLRLIRWETAKLWGRIGRAALRSGGIDLRDAVAVRPEHMGMGYARLDGLIMSRLIGGVRRARRQHA